MGQVKADPVALRSLAAELDRTANELIEFTSKYISEDVDGWDDDIGRQFSAVMKKMGVAIVAPSERLFDCSDKIELMADSLEGYQRTKF